MMSMRLPALLLLALFSHSALADGGTPTISRGRYLVKITGCNDCHTPMFGPRNGAVPEKEWLVGDPTGWKGPWGTTYAGNLRKRAATMSESQWVTYFKQLRTRPPMPYYALNAMVDSDIASIYRFIRSLGDSDHEVPVGLPPGVTPTTPYFNFDVILPNATAKTPGT